MPDRSGPPTLQLALRCVLDAAVEGRTRGGLLAAVRPDEDPGGPTSPELAGPRVVVPFPRPRPPQDDDPNAA